MLIVDEASMISQSLMKALFEAIPSNAKLIMLGDMQQLASVESGMVLRDFCLAAEDNDILSGNVIELKENHRSYMLNRECAPMPQHHRTDPNQCESSCAAPPTA